MENLNERAANYAAEKTNELLTKAIAQAYADGYRDGVKDRDEGVVSPNIEFVDLGLPSGTKWSTKLIGEGNFADYFAYADAASFELPTIEQVEELSNYCRWKANRSSSGQTFWGATCIGKNGKIYIRSWGYKEGDRLCCHGYGADTIFFWIRNEEDGDEMKAIKLFNVKDEKPEIEIVKLFSGYKVPIMLVHKK